MPFLSKQLLAIVLLLLSVKSYSATIKGNVSDKVSGEPLVGAVIMLHGTQFGTTVGLDGSYTIHNIPAGEYDLEIMLTSFETIKEHIKLTDEQILIINRKLESNSKLLTEVEVKAKVKNGSDEQARNMEKNSSVVLNIISARTIELLPDITVANVMQRVSGVQVQRDGNGEARYAAI